MFSSQWRVLLASVIIGIGTFFSRDGPVNYFVVCLVFLVSAMLYVVFQNRNEKKEG